jgi:stage III sporulation protein AD
MADAVRILSFGVVAVILVLVVKQYRPDMAPLIGLACGVVLIVWSLERFSWLWGWIKNALAKTGVNGTYIGILIKITLLAVLFELGTDMCADAGETAVATKMELAGKLVILITALPILVGLIDLLSGLLG